MRTRSISCVLAVAAMIAAAGCDNTSNTGPAQSTTPAVHNSDKGHRALDNCLDVFQGITHCSIGQTNLTDVNNEVHVDGYTNDGNSGVSSSFATAHSWLQTLQTQFPNDNQGGFTLNAKDGETVASSLQINQDATPNHFQVTPSFTGGQGGSSNYSVHVFNNGQDLGGDDNVPAGIIIIIWWSNGDVWIIDTWWWWDIGFFQIANPGGGDDGACKWQLAGSPGTQVSVQLPSGAVLTGDQVVFQEKIANGAYPYNNFTSIDQTGNLKSSKITQESASN